MGRRVITGLFAAAAISLATAAALAEDEICRSHKPDEEINAKAKDIALKLLDGQPSFVEDFTDYRDALKKVKGSWGEAELLVDMHCLDPQDVQVQITMADGKFHSYQIDTWRIAVNNSVVFLGGGKYSGAEVAAGVKDVPKADIDLFVADFNRDAVIFNVNWRAKKSDSGEIEFVEAKK